jgi:hypothetical protein
MNRLLWSFSAAFFALSVAACASPQDETASAEGITPVAEVAAEQLAQNAPLPVAIAPAAPGGPEDALIVPVAYACADGRSFTAAFPADGRSVRVAAAGRSLVLPHSGAADAVMFSDGEATLTADGAEATLSGVDGLYAGCMAG